MAYPPPAVLIVQMQRACDQVAVDRAQAPPITLRAKLERLRAFDQAGREELSKIDAAHLLPEQQSVFETALACMSSKDQANQRDLEGLLPRRGWFNLAILGGAAVQGAWLVADHATNNPALMRNVLARVRPLARSGGAFGRAYAIMADRIAITFDHRPQVYGTQVECRGGEWRPVRLADPDRVDARRRRMGFRDSEVAYLLSFGMDPCS